MVTDQPASYIAMETTISFNSSHYNIQNARGLMNPGNFSVSFVPLLAVMANVVPRILTRFRRPTQMVSGRDFRNARIYFEESFDNELCTSMNSFELKGVPQNPDLFYKCKLKENVNQCKLKIADSDRGNKKDFYEKFLIGKISSSRGCYFLKVYKCPTGSIFKPVNIFACTYQVK